MKQPVMCGNSAAAVSTQRQHSYGLFSVGKARWQNGQPAQFEAHTVDFCAWWRQAMSLGFSKMES